MPAESSSSLGDPTGTSSLGGMSTPSNAEHVVSVSGIPSVTPLGQHPAQNNMKTKIEKGNYESKSRFARF